MKKIRGNGTFKKAAFFSVCAVSNEINNILVQKYNGIKLKNMERIVK